MRVLCCTLVAMLLHVSGTAAQPSAEIQAILDKAVKAHYPKGRDEKTLAYHGKNKGTIFISGLELEFNQQVWVMAPGKFKEVVEMSIMGKEVKVTSAFDGKVGWIRANEMDVPVKEELLDEFKNMAYWMRIGQLTGLTDKGLKFGLIGEAEVNGKRAIGITIAKEGAKDISFFFDKATGLMAKTERRTRDFMTGQEVTEERVIQGYQEIGGRPMPKRVVVNRDGAKLMEVEVLEGRHLERLDDSEFAKP